MKKIALALAISSALASHFALAASGDGEAPTLTNMEIKTNTELETTLNKVNGNTGNKISNIIIRTDKKGGAVPVTDVGTYEAIERLNAGLRKDLQRSNEINARILANAVSGKLEKNDLIQAEEKAITECSRQLTSALTNNTDVQEVFKGTPLSVAFGSLSTASNVGDIFSAIEKIGETFNKFKELTTNFSIDKITPALNNVIPGFNFNNLTTLDIKNLEKVGPKIKDLEGKYGNARQVLNGTTAVIKTSAYKQVYSLTTEFKDKLETSRDRELLNDSVRRVTEQCDKASKVAENAVEGLNREVDALKEIRVNADAVLAGKCKSAREVKNLSGESGECKRVLGLGS